MHQPPIPKYKSSAVQIQIPAELRKPHEIQPKVLYEGLINPDHIQVQINTPSRRDINSEFSKETKEWWCLFQQTAKEQGQIAYNGKLWRLDSISSQNGNLQINIGKIYFADMLPLIRNIKKIEKYGDSYLPRAIAVPSLFKTVDGYFLFGQKGKTTLDYRTIDYVGGMVETKDPSTGAALWNTLLTELKEEINVDPTSIQTSQMHGIIQTTFGNVSALFSIESSLTKREVEMFFPDRSDKEFSKLHFMKENEVSDFLLQTNISWVYLWNLYLRTRST